MRETPVCVRVQADRAVIGRVEVLGREPGSIRVSKTSSSRLRTPTRPQSVGHPWGVFDRVGIRKTAAPRSMMLKGSCGFRVPFGPWRQQLRHSRRPLPPKGRILVSVRSTRPPTRHPTRPSHCSFRVLGRTLAWIVFASRAPARPPTVWDQRREAPVPGDAWSP